MTGTGVHLFKIPNAAFCLPSSVTLQSTKESTCVWKLGWNTLSFLFYINVKSRKIELSSIFYQKRRARSFPRSEIFSEGRVDATRVLIFSSALRKFTYAISSHIRLNTLVWAQKKLSAKLGPDRFLTLWSLKILSLTFNYQLISWCSGVWPIISAICLVDLRYSKPKSAEKWPFPHSA